MLTLSTRSCNEPPVWCRRLFPRNCDDVKNVSRCWSSSSALCSSSYRIGIAIEMLICISFEFVERNGQFSNNFATQTLNISLLFSLSFGPLYEYASSNKFFSSVSSKSRFWKYKSIKRWWWVNSHFNSLINNNSCKIAQQHEWCVRFDTVLTESLCVCDTC